MKRQFDTWFLTVLTGAFTILSPGFIRTIPAIAQPEGFCDDPGTVAAAETTRDLELEQFGIELTIPSNFRAMLLNNSNVKIVDPGTYELLVCIARGGDALGRGYAQTLVRTVGNPENLELRQLVERNIRENQEISPYSLNGESGYLVESPNDYAAEFWVEIDAVPGAVVISRSCDCPGMRESLVSLLDRSSLLDSSQTALLCPR
ncbi:hypothetical protein C7B61_05610 [filamentous cyanobacterium CCP1]|nr:hypothetical protein C7B76_10100 [filamentous cyanobacterium CCP2]PSB67545.1 hypothetical protein C7B61_05610 [filamentous cyanobacterium CCP1]